MCTPPRVGALHRVVQVVRCFLAQGGVGWGIDQLTLGLGRYPGVWDACTGRHLGQLSQVVGDNSNGEWEPAQPQQTHSVVRAK